MLECMPKTRLAVLIHAKTTTLSWPCLSVPGLPLQRNVRAGEQRSGNEGQVAHPPGVPVTDIASGVSKFCGKRPPAKGSSVYQKTSVPAVPSIHTVSVILESDQMSTEICPFPHFVEIKFCCPCSLAMGSLDGGTASSRGHSRHHLSSGVEAALSHTAAAEACRKGPRQG